MKSEGAWTEDQGAWAEADLPIMSDLRLRLQGSQEQEVAARTEARRLARELAIAHRLLKFSGGTALPPRTRPPEAVEVPRLAAALLTARVILHLDYFRNEDDCTAITGWAFRPAPDWDARATAVTLLFRHDTAIYRAAATRVPRPDVAAHFAAQPTGASGGAAGLDGAGFACKILHGSLPTGVDLEITLRLECGPLACEQATGTRLRL